jgi:hypothetical protein
MNIIKILLLLILNIFTINVSGTCDSRVNDCVGSSDYSGVYVLGTLIWFAFLCWLIYELCWAPRVALSEERKKNNSNNNRTDESQNF